MEYNDEYIQDLLYKMRKKRYNYFSRLKRTNVTTPAEMNNIFNRLGIFTKQGKVLSVEQFKEKYNRQINYKVSIMQDLLRPEFFKEKDKQFKVAISQMLSYMGNLKEAEKVDKMSLKEFRKNFYAGNYDNLKEHYETSKAFEYAETIASKSKFELTPEILDLLGE